MNDAQKTLYEEWVTKYRHEIVQAIFKDKTASIPDVDAALAVAELAFEGGWRAAFVHLTNEADGKTP